MSKEINNTKTGIDLSSFYIDIKNKILINELYKIKEELEEMIIELEKMKEGIRNV